MPWSGSGTFTRVYGASGWTDDKNSGIKILSSRHDAHDQDLADGINACLTRDNQAKPTASLLPATDNTINLGSGSFRWASINGVVFSQFPQLAQNNAFTKSGTGNTAAIYIATSGANPFIAFASGLDSSGNRLWDMGVDTERFIARVGNDASSSFTNWLVVDRTANVVDNINLLATAVQVNGVDITASTGTFTATLASGLTTTPTGTLTYKKIGNVVTLYNNSGSGIQGTSNSTSWSITGLPAAIQPAAGTRTIPCYWVDNGSTVAGFLQLTASSGTMGPNSNTGTFTGSGTKGIPAGWSVTYSL
jgi:hypothetical protein